MKRPADCSGGSKECGEVFYVTTASDHLRNQARTIWDAAVAAVRPDVLVQSALADTQLAIRDSLSNARRILVVGAGKAGALMAIGVEQALSDCLDRVEGIINVPAGAPLQPRAIHLHAARPVAANQPTEQGVVGTRQILDLLAHADANDVALCLISGGGSALLPAPAEGVSLVDKQQVTKLLHACGATINEMNTVRKHLSQSKGGRLAQAFTGRALFSLIISDVIGDPLDVIASGPTAADPTTFADALAVLNKYQLAPLVPPNVLTHLQKGASGQIPETPKLLPPNIHNYVIGNNALALSAASAAAARLGYPVLNLGSYVEGEAREVATAFVGIVRSIREQGQPLKPPVCILSGGETTVTLAEHHGLGGRNQEFVLAAAVKLGRVGLQNTVVLSAGTDGEDGPTDAAGAIANETTLPKAEELGLTPTDYLARNDAYHFFEKVGGLFKTGLTHTNVMDVCVILVS